MVVMYTVKSLEDRLQAILRRSVVSCWGARADDEQQTCLPITRYALSKNKV